MARKPSHFGSWSCAGAIAAAGLTNIGAAVGMTASPMSPLAVRGSPAPNPLLLVAAQGEEVGLVVARWDERAPAAHRRPVLEGRGVVELAMNAGVRVRAGHRRSAAARAPARATHLLGHVAARRRRGDPSRLQPARPRRPA